MNNPISTITANDHPTSSVPSLSHESTVVLTLSSLCPKPEVSLSLPPSISHAVLEGSHQESDSVQSSVKSLSERGIPQTTVAETGPKIVASETKTLVPTNIPVVGSEEEKILKEARDILNSGVMDSILSAHIEGKTKIVEINKTLIQYEPMNRSGMSMFCQSGFVLGKVAFSSASELKKTVLYLLYTLNTSASEILSEGINKSSTSRETSNADDFANKYFEEITLSPNIMSFWAN
jgi:hypothetical protein